MLFLVGTHNRIQRISVHTPKTTIRLNLERIKRGAIILSVYTGQISHKLSSKHKTGEKRSVVGVTDNKTFGAIFGVFGQVGAKSSNGKIQMLEIDSPDPMKNEIFVDPSELQKINEETFLKNNVQRIKMWTAVANYLEETSYSDMQGILNGFANHFDFKTLGNRSRAAIAQLYFNQTSKEEVKNILDTESTKESTKDALSRSVISVIKKGVIEYHGMEALATISVFSGKKGLIINGNNVTLTIKVELDSTISGSKTNIKGPNSKAYKEQFTALKNMGTDIAKKISGTKYEHRLRARSSLNERMEELRDFAINDTLEAFKLLEGTLKSISPHDLGLDKIDDFNPATAIKHLWTELHLSSEITFAGFKPKTANEELRRYWNGEITANDFVDMYSDIFVNQLKLRVANRYKEENVAIDKYTKTVVERTQDDFPNISVEDLSKGAELAITEVIGIYRNKILEVQSIKEALNLYWAPNSAHDNTIISEAISRLNDNVGRFISDKNKELKASVETFFRDYLGDVIADAWKGYLQEHSSNLVEDQKLALDQKWIDDVLPECVSELFATTKINLDNYQESIITFTLNILEPSSRFEPNKWFDKHFQNAKTDNEEVRILRNTINDTIIPTIALKHGVNNTTDNFILSKLDILRSELFEVLNNYRIEHSFSELFRSGDYMNQQANVLSGWDEIEQYKIDTLSQLISEKLIARKIDNNISNVNKMINSIPVDFKSMYLSYSTDYVSMTLNQYIDEFQDILTKKISESEQKRDELRLRIKNTIKSASFYFPGQIENKLRLIKNEKTDSQYIDQRQNVILAVTDGIYKRAAEEIMKLSDEKVLELMSRNYYSTDYVYENLNGWMDEVINDLDIDKLGENNEDINGFIEYARSLTPTDLINDAKNLINEYLAEHGIKDTVNKVTHPYVESYYTKAELNISKGVYDRTTRFLTDKDEQKSFSDPNKLIDHAIYDDDDWKENVVTNSLDIKDLKYDLIDDVSYSIAPELPEFLVSDISDTLNKLPGYEIFNISLDKAKEWVEEHYGDDLKSKVFVTEKDEKIGKKIIYDIGLEQLMKYIENLTPKLSQDDIKALDLPKAIDKFVDSESERIFEQLYAMDLPVSDIDAILYNNLSPENMGAVYLPQNKVDSYWDDLEDEVIGKLNRESGIDNTEYWINVVHNNLEDASKLYYDKLSVHDFMEKFSS